MFATVLGVLSLFIMMGIFALLLKFIFKPITHLQFIVACCGVGLVTLSFVALFAESLTFSKRWLMSDEETIDCLVLSATRNLLAAESAMRKLAQCRIENLRRDHSTASPQKVLQMEQEIKRELEESLNRLRRIAIELGLQSQN